MLFVQIQIKMVFRNSIFIVKWLAYAICIETWILIVKFLWTRMFVFKHVALAYHNRDVKTLLFVSKGGGYLFQLVKPSA